MRVLQVTPRYPPQTGGVETHVREISERLVERGHEVTVLTADAGTSGFRRERRNGVRVRRYRSFAPDGTIHICPQIADAVRRADANVVHAHNYHSFPLFFAALGVGSRRFVATPHYHGGSANALRDRLFSLYSPCGGWAIQRADAVIAVSEWERDRLDEGFGVKATVIPNGINVERFASAEPVVRDRPYLLTVGRLSEYKGVQHLIRTMSELPEYDLLIAGRGEYRDQLERVAQESGVEDRIAFLGYVDEAELPRLYAGAQVFVTLSEFEAYGMTVGEALAAGTPCVVRNTGALSEWTNREGVEGLRSMDPSALADAIRRLDGSTPAPKGVTWARVTESVEERYRIG